MGGSDRRRLKMEMDRKGGWQKGGVCVLYVCMYLSVCVTGRENLSERMVCIIKYV